MTVADDTSFDIITAPKRDSRHWERDSITWGEVRAWLDTPADKKEAGNYLFGTIRQTTTTHPVKGKEERRTCTNWHRSKDAIVTRTMMCLDVDYPPENFADMFEITLGYTAIMHTTWKSNPSVPRYRIIIPVDRPMLPDEYIVVANVLMNQLGLEHFDKGSEEPERYMFMPSTQRADWFQTWEWDGTLLDVDDVLASAPDFEEDLSNRPMPTTGQKKRDPFTMEGVIGAFNRAYEDFQVLIEEYELPYEVAGMDRWHLVGARSQAGMGIVDDGLVYSHHANDPAHGTTCTAFDLVRLHRFHDLDDYIDPNVPINKKPSHLAMLDLASVDARVTAELVGLDFDVIGEADDDDSDDAPQTWRMDLRMSSSRGKLIDDMDNWDLITSNDPLFTNLVFNELTLSVETTRDFPWRSLAKGGATLTSTDRTKFIHYIERNFKFRATKQFVDGLIDTAAQERFINPIRDFLETLEWDGVPRMETCLPGVKPTDYTRLVARKSLVAAVARIMEPGCKWDHTLILFGLEGLGKSYWIDRMSLGYSANLGRIDHKDTLLTMQRSWIMVSDEGATLRKADADATKEFLTRREDVFRLPYERDAQAHPRHCVIWGTTNDQTFLRRQEGNRRFLIVHCQERADFTTFRDDYVHQVWAEALHYYRQGELLFLDDTESTLAASHREEFIEEDALAGVIQEFLDRPVPEDYLELSPEQRQIWQTEVGADLVPKGTWQQQETCSAQIWVEALGKRFGDHKRTDLIEITKSLRNLGWITVGSKRVPGYGPQVVFRKPISDLI